MLEDVIEGSMAVLGNSICGGVGACKSVGLGIASAVVTLVVVEWALYYAYKLFGCGLKGLTLYYLAQRWRSLFEQCYLEYSS